MPQPAFRNRPLATGLSQRASHNRPLTTGLSQPASHNGPLTTDLSQALEGRQFAAAAWRVTIQRAWREWKHMAKSEQPPQREIVTNNSVKSWAADDAQFDIAIAGGGIAGLWLLNRLSQLGYSTVLLEKNALGTGQTLASQGIVHGGLKYALNGVLSPASSAIAEMPARWARCLDGQGDIDLRATRRLSEHYYMWSGGSMRSRLKTFLGSKALRGRIDPLDTADYPTFMNPFGTSDSVKGVLYRLPDFVVDTPSLLEKLAAPWRERIFQCPDLSIHTLTDQGCRLSLGDDRTTIDCRRVIL